MVEVMKIMVTPSKRSHACTATLSAPSLAAGHHRPMPLLETPGHSRASLGQSPLAGGFFRTSATRKVPKSDICLLSISWRGALEKGRGVKRTVVHRGEGWAVMQAHPNPVRSGGREVPHQGSASVLVGPLQTVVW